RGSYVTFGSTRHCEFLRSSRSAALDTHKTREETLSAHSHSNRTIHRGNRKSPALLQILLLTPTSRGTSMGRSLRRAHSHRHSSRRNQCVRSYRRRRCRRDCSLSKERTSHRSEHPSIDVARPAWCAERSRLCRSAFVLHPAVPSTMHRL